MELSDRKIAELKDEFGEDAAVTVLRTVKFLSDIIGVDRALAEPLKAGCHRMAELVNDMLPALATARRTETYDHRDLNGCLDDLPTRVQNTFVQLVGTLMLNSKDGPYQAAAHIEEGIDQLAAVWGEEAA